MYRENQGTETSKKSVSNKDSMYLLLNRAGGTYGDVGTGPHQVLRQRKEKKNNFANFLIF